MAELDTRLAQRLAELHDAGTYKVLRRITTPMDTQTHIDGVGEVLVFCSNNYLGLANHPEVLEAARDGLNRYGAGTASVRFICGTFECHEALEARVAEFIGTEAALTYSSCWNANEGLLPALAQDGDVIISDESNITSTFGKALGGGNGGFVAGSRDLVDYLVQRSRPHLFSNALAPPTACAALAALEILQQEPERVARLHDNVSSMREGLGSLGYDVMDSPTGIIPIMIGDTAQAIRMSERLLEMGIFVVGFGYPVVAEGKARLRVQMSAAHSQAQIDRALDAFANLKASPE